MVVCDLKNYLKNILVDVNPADYFVFTSAEDVPDIFLTCMEHFYEEEEQDECDYTEESEDDFASEEQKECVKEYAVDVVNEQHRLIILGNPGTGKTTLLLYLLKTMAEKFSTEQSGDLPIYIPLKELTEQRQLSAILYGYITHSDYAGLFSEGKVVLLVDGLNEVKRSLYDSTVSALLDFMERYPSCGLVVTSRSYGYSGGLNLPCFSLNGFDDDNIQEYIYKQTGKDLLYHELEENQVLRSLANNPLLLSMLVHVWRVDGKIPRARFYVYKLFVQYLLEKNGVTGSDFYRYTETLSKLAFSMRTLGLISVTYTEMYTMINDTDDENCIDIDVLELLSCGLLSHSVKEDDLHKISFIHETFQEYFASLYLLKDIQTERYNTVDFTLPEWEEVLNLLCERLENIGDFYSFDRLLQHVVSSYEKESETAYFNDSIGRMFIKLQASIPISGFLRHWLAEYLLFNMGNFIKLPRYDQVLSRFQAVLIAAETLNDPDICSLFFRSYRWLKYWLYKEDEIGNICSMYKTTELRVMNLHVKKFSGKDKIFLALSRLRDEYDCFEAIYRRVNFLLTSLANAATADESKAMYEQTHDLNILLKTFDVDYIDKETRGCTNLVFTNLAKIYKEMDIDMSNFMFCTLVDRMNENGKEKLFSESVLPFIIYNNPGLEERLLADERYRSFKTHILKACYQLPASCLSKYYFDFIRQLRMSIPRKGLVSSLFTFFDQKGGAYHVIDKKFSDLEESIWFNDFLYQHSSVELRSFYMYTFSIVEHCSIEETNKMDLNKIDLYFEEGSLLLVDSEKIVYLTENTIKLNNDGTDRFSVCINNKILLVGTAKNEKVNVLVGPASLKLFDIVHVLAEYDLSNIMSLYHMFRPEFWTKNNLDPIRKLTTKEKNVLGVSTMFIEPNEAVLKNLGIVRDVKQGVLSIQLRKDLTIKTVQKRFTDFRINDVVYLCKNRPYLVVKDTNLYKAAFMEGNVIQRSGNNLFISTKESQDGDYYFYDKENGYDVGDSVRFFPLKNAYQRFKGLPMACAIQKIWYTTHF